MALAHRKHFVIRAEPRGFKGVGFVRISGKACPDFGAEKQKMIRRQKNWRGGVVIAGRLGAGTLGAVKYREQKRKKERPWTAYAEKIERRRQRRLIGGPVAQARARFDEWRESQISPVFNCIKLKNERMPATDVRHFGRSRHLLDRN